MGEEFLKNLTVYKKSLFALDNIAKDIIGESVISRVYDASKKMGSGYNRTIYTHTSIFMVEYSLASALIEAGVVP